jgi:sugar transferase (PEP-CTERM/EpsH1 system associated)
LTGPRPAVLYVVHRVPYPPDKGDRIRAYHILRQLSRHADVHLASLADEAVPPQTRAALQRLCARVEIVPLGPRTRWLWALGSLAAGRSISEGAFHSPALVDVVRRWAQQTPFRAALASASSVAPYLRVPELRGVTAVVDLVDVDSQKWLDYAAAGRGPRSWVYRLEGRRLRRREAALAEWASAVTLVSDHEAALYRAMAPHGPTHAIANGVDLEYFQPPAAWTAGSGCVFVGQLDYRPNVDAACWFVREVWPGVHGRHPEARLQLVGRQPTAEVRRLAGVPGVEVVGQVPDVRPYLTGAAVAVAPLRLARGVQNKVLEAMAMARPVVASPPALAGLGNPSRLPTLLAGEPQEWVEAVGDLLGDEAERRRLGQAGRRYVEEHHSWQRCLNPFLGLLGLQAGAEPSEEGTAAVGAQPDAVG